MKYASLTSVLGLLLTVVMTPTPVRAASFFIADGDVAGLIAAIETANTNADPSNTINLAAGGTYTLTAANAAANACCAFFGPTGLPPIRKPLIINGNGATIQRSSAPGTPAFRILFMYTSPVVAGMVNLTLDHVTIRGGLGEVPAGTPVGSGGALAMSGNTVLIRNSTITDNYGYEGGAIANFGGSLIVENSTISYNIGYGGRTGGGILNASFHGPPPSQATTVIVNSTIFENRADGFPGFQGRGDAIADAFSPAGSIIIKNSVIASPTWGLGADCWAFRPDSRGYNIASDGSCGFSNTGDLNGTDPLLGPLANNGGLTPTHLPLAGSPALDAIPLAACTDLAGNPVTTDQRDVARPNGPACDIGAVDASAGPTYHIYLLFDPYRAVKSGATIPIKLQLRDNGGANLSSADLVVQATTVVQISSSMTDPVEDAGNSNPDYNFRYDPSLGGSGGYIFNLKTTGLTTGTYRMLFTVGAGAEVHALDFQVK